MPSTQRKRSFQFFRKLHFCSSSISDDETLLEIDKMMLHILDSLSSLHCVMGKYDNAKARVFWNAVKTIAEIGMDSVDGHMDKRHPGATHLLRAFPSDNIKSSDNRGWLPLHWASVCDDVTLDDFKNIARADPLAAIKGYNAFTHISASPGHLVAAVRYPDMKNVKVLYDFYPRMAYMKDKDGDLPLHYAARYTQSNDMITFLLQANPLATKVRGSADLLPLHCALYNEHAESRLRVVKCLLEADPESARLINSDGDTTLHIGVDSECNLETLKMLLKTFPDASKTVNDIGMLPLHAACLLNNSDAHDIIFEFLSIYAEAVRVKNSSGLLAIHLAAEHSTVETVKLLLETYPESRFEVAYGTPLHHAVSGCRSDIVTYFCQNYPECAKLTNTDGLTPLHHAVTNADLSIVKTLYNVYPEAVRFFSNNKKLPLHMFTIEEFSYNIAETDPDVDILRFLLKVYPEAVDIPNEEGMTPYAMCPLENTLFRRLMLRAKPQLNYAEFIELNYRPRRMAMFLSYCAINAIGEPNIFCRMREKSTELLKHCISYL